MVQLTGRTQPCPGSSCPARAGESVDLPGHAEQQCPAGSLCAKRAAPRGHVPEHPPAVGPRCGTEDTSASKPPGDELAHR
eukprot:14352365-Alexandrium_andersonii.AAC.1